MKVQGQRNEKFQKFLRQCERMWWSRDTCMITAREKITYRVREGRKKVLNLLPMCSTVCADYTTICLCSQTRCECLRTWPCRLHWNCFHFTFYNTFFVIPREKKSARLCNRLRDCLHCRLTSVSKVILCCVRVPSEKKVPSKRKKMSDKMFHKIRFNFNAHLEEFVDFVFHVNGQSFKVHRVTLAGAKEFQQKNFFWAFPPQVTHSTYMCVECRRWPKFHVEQLQ